MVFGFIKKILGSKEKPKIGRRKNSVKKKPAKKSLPKKKKKVKRLSTAKPGIKKTSKKRTTSKKGIKKEPSRKLPAKKSTEKEAGIITHYFGKISVAVIKLKATLTTGDKIRVKGAGDDFTQLVSSMQINHKEGLIAKKGQEIGMKVRRKAHQNSRIYLVK